MKVYDKCCKNCLFSEDRIVSKVRATEIIQDCARTQGYFICHKASIGGEDICCRSFYDKFGHLSQNIRIAERLGGVEFVAQPKAEKLPAYREMSRKGGNK